MFGAPESTSYDVKFRLLDVPVRIHPLFWVMAAAIGWNDRDGLGVLIWVGCVLVSIIVHEFGHALTARAVAHERPSVVLYVMGGLCLSSREQTPWRRVAVVAMGPGAGFLLCALVGILGTIVLGILPTAPELGILPGAVYRWFPRLLESQVHALPRWAASQPVLEAYRSLLWINFWWGVFNLVPIFPLDGGQLAQAFLTMHNPREGVRRSYIVGMITASLLAIYLFNQGQQINAFFVAFLALTNLQLLQAAHYQRIHTDASDDDWWRR